MTAFQVSDKQLVRQYSVVMKLVKPMKKVEMNSLAIQYLKTNF